jgi:hypothetical protein
MFRKLGISEMWLPAELLGFCSENQVTLAFEQTVALARRHFSTVGDPWCELVQDDDCEEYYMAIHVNVSGGPEAVFGQSEAFLDAFVAAVDKRKQRLISLVYHSN